MIVEGFIDALWSAYISYTVGKMMNSSSGGAERRIRMKDRFEKSGQNA